MRTFVNNSFIIRRMAVQYLLITIGLLSFSNPSNGNILYVKAGASGTGSAGDPAGLQSALDKARVNGADDTLMLQEGLYDASGGAFSYVTNANDNHDILLSGGWNSEYTSHSSDPGATVLDGDNASRVLFIGANKPGLNYSFSLEYITIQNGYTTTENGAGIMAYSGAASGSDTGRLRLYLNHCHVINNRAMSNHSGGGVMIHGYFEMEECRFISNNAYNGGAIFATTFPDNDQSITPEIDHCYFENNTNYGNQGSTIWHNVQLELTNSTILGRSDGVSSSGPGSAVWGNGNGSTRVYNCLFKDIHISYWGSAIQSFDGNLEIVNTIFDHNTAGSISGYAAVAYYHDNSPVPRNVVLTNCTFVGNKTMKSVYTGALHLRLDANDTCTITNCIFWDNGMAAILNQFGGKATISYSDIENGLTNTQFTDGGNNIIADPLFADTADFHLTGTSPCINTGNNNARAILPTDYEGTIRILGGTIDMGAYEFNRPPLDFTLSTDTIEENSGYTWFAKFVPDDPDAGDAFEYFFEEGNGTNDADNDKFSIHNDTLFIDENPNYEAQASYHLYLKVIDSGNESYIKGFTIEVKDRNDPPVLISHIPDTLILVDDLFTYTIPATYFYDEDAGDVLTFTATLENDDPLPSWLGFSAVPRTFVGTPSEADTLNIKVTANDQGGSAVYDVFTLWIQEAGAVKNPVISTVHVYPNPSIGSIIFVDMPAAGSETELYFTDNIGREISVPYVLNDAVYKVNIRDISPGNYYLYIITDQGIYYAKVVIDSRQNPR